MLEYDRDRRDRASDGDEGATGGRPSDVEEATDEELSDAIAGIELGDPHSATGHGVTQPDASSDCAPDGVFDLDDGRAAGSESEDVGSQDAEGEDAGPFRSLLSRVL